MQYYGEDTMLKSPKLQTPTPELSDAQVRNIVSRSYPYVAMYNVNNKFAMDPANPSSTGGWNRVKAQLALLDHTIKAIARPNNDTLYATAMLDLRNQPIILESPAFDSNYVSLMVTGYDHYVNIPMSTQQGDFSEPARILFYTKRTVGYDGKPIEGIDYIAPMTGDFVSAVYRVMPHQTDPARLQRNIEAMQGIKVLTLAEYQGKALPEEGADIEFPAFGKTDFDIFEHNLLEVMQFVFNHTSLDPTNELDRQLLEAYEPLGVVPGQSFDPTQVATLDGKRFRIAAEDIATRELAKAREHEFMAKVAFKMFKPKGQIVLETLLFHSVLGPIGLPASETIYRQILAPDGGPMNALHDYVIAMTVAELPPAKAFWSFTLYDTENGFFIPNNRKKYSVGENGGYRLNEDGGIAIYIAEQKPEGVPEENWLPLNRGDYDIDLQLRIYAPDLDRYQQWTPPVAKPIH
jgi:hypothetical protein